MDGRDHVLGDKFQKRVLDDTMRWDREWLRYLDNNADHGPYFYDMSGPAMR